MWTANTQGRQATEQVRFPLEICWSCEDPSPLFSKLMYIPLECFSSDKLMFSPSNMFHRKISEQPSLWFIKPSNQATQETTCEFMVQQRQMETPDLLSPGYSISPLQPLTLLLCPGLLTSISPWACSAFEWTPVKASVVWDCGVDTVVLFWVESKENLGEQAKKL